VRFDQDGGGTVELDDVFALWALGGRRRDGVKEMGEFGLSDDRLEVGGRADGDARGVEQRDLNLRVAGSALKIAVCLRGEF
jgi:hypothetical protein